MKNKPYPPKDLWETTHEWLVLCGNKVDKNFCRQEITTHPDYPALTSVVDFLTLGHMAYTAISTDASYIHEFHYPLLAHIRQPGNEHMRLVREAADWSADPEIYGHWSGIILMPGRDMHWHNEQNDQLRREAVHHWVMRLASVIVAVFLVAMASIWQWSAHPLNLALPSVIFGVLSLAGLVVSLLALGAELGIQHQLVRQVCGVFSRGGCEQVLKSSYARGIMGITPADAAVAYFGAQQLCFLLTPLYPGFLQMISWLSFGGVAVAVASTYVQAVKLKQWCAICLGIVAVLVLQAAIALVLPMGMPGVWAAGGFVFLFALLLTWLLPLKQLIKTNRKNSTQLAELKKWKLDAGLFSSQWMQEETADAAVWERDLLLGDPEAPLLITVACNPYCGPCARAHKQLDELLDRFDGKVKVQVRLLSDVYNEQDRRSVAVKAILRRRSEAENNGEVQAMLSEWFEWMNYDKWIGKWRGSGHADPGLDEEVNLRHAWHSQWVEQSNIRFTPTFFVNGRKLPGRYGIDDLALLIPQLVDPVNA